MLQSSPHKSITKMEEVFADELGAENVERPHKMYLMIRSFLASAVLFLLLPTVIVGVLALPLLLLGSLIPVIGLFTLSCAIFLLMFLYFSWPVVLYLLFAQKDSDYASTMKEHPRWTAVLPFIRWGPLRSGKLWIYTFHLLAEGWRESIWMLPFDWVVQRVLFINTPAKDRVLFENVKMRYWKPDRTSGVMYADIYKPPPQLRTPSRPRTNIPTSSVSTPTSSIHIHSPLGSRSSSPSQSQATVVENSPTSVEARLPVVVYLGMSGYRFWARAMGTLAALRLRRMGYVVVVPDCRAWDEKIQSGASMDDMVTDLRRTLKWTGEHIHLYGGNEDDLYLMGYGSGAHVSLLTIVQEGIITAREAYERYRLSKQETASASASAPKRRTSIYSVVKGHPNDLISGLNQPMLSAGLTSVTLPPDAPRAIPQVQGMILIGGVCDVVKQGRWQVGWGVEEVSCLRRVCGPSPFVEELFLHCPSHLLFAATELLQFNDPLEYKMGTTNSAYLPKKFLIIGGGRDQVVPYTQAVLLDTLLSNINNNSIDQREKIDVRLKLYKEMGHLGALKSLMKQTRYSPLIFREIEALIEG